MSAIVEDLKNYMLYNKKIYLPVNDDDRKHGSAIYLFTPDLGSSKDIINSVYNGIHYDGKINWESYYMEKDMSFYFHNESHTMSRVQQDLILEDGEYTLKNNTKGTLDEFHRVEITEEVVDQYMDDCDKVSGLIGYFPWTGYLYLDENDNIVAGLNINVDDRDIYKIFVVDEEKYGYLYKDLITEARKMKANYCTIKKEDTSAIKALEEFGFTKTEDLQDCIKMQYKIPIMESTIEDEAIDYVEHCTWLRSINIMYEERYKALKKLMLYYCDFYHIRKDIGLLAARVWASESDLEKEGMNTLLGDLRSIKYFSKEDIEIAYQAARLADNQKFMGETIYDRIMFDGTRLIHYTDIDVIIRDEVHAYYCDHNIYRSKDFVYMDEVDEIVANIKRKHDKSSINHLILNISYSYYRKEHKKVQKAINKGLANKIIIDYSVTVRESAEDDIAANILNESHVSFGYKDEVFECNSDDWDKIKTKIDHKIGYYLANENKANKGIVIKDGNDIKGVVKVNEFNMITEMMWNDIHPSYLLMIAERKFNANKAAIPEDCTPLIDIINNTPNWHKMYSDKGYAYYDCYSQDRMPYKDIGISKDIKAIYNKLSDTDKEYLGNQYLNPVCITNTIWYKCLGETALVDVYIQPSTPTIGWIDIAVVESQRGKGYATRLIREAQEEIKKNYKDIDALGWVCKSDNKASYNLATKTGFVPYKETDGHRFLLWTIHSTDMIPNTFTEEAEIEEWNSRGFEEVATINDGNVAMLIDEDVSKVMDDAKFGTKLKKIMWEDRIRNNKQVLQIYEDIKKSTPIKNTFLDLKLYKKRNLFVDLSFYNVSFFNNYSKNIQPNEKKINEFYFELMSRLINDKRITSIYNKINVIIPIEDWCKENLRKTDKSADAVRRADYWENLSPIGALLYYAEKNPLRLSTEFKDINFIFISESGAFFKANFSDYEKGKDFIPFRTSVDKLLRRIHVPEDKSYDKKAIIHSMLDRMETGDKKITINSINVPDTETKANKELVVGAKVDNKPATDEEKKKEVVKVITKAAEKAKTPDDAADEVEKDQYEKKYTEKLLKDLADNETGNVKLSAARSQRLDNLSQKFLDQKVVDNSSNFQGTMRDYINYNSNADELPETALPIESINEGWKHLKFTNFDARYSVRADIYAILYSFENKSSRLAINGEIKIEDTSTTEDWKETWTVPFEADTGKRFKLKFDLPLLKDNRNMVLGGNDKTMNGQLVLLPISKTDEDTAQIVSLYNKIFIRRYSVGNGKSNRSADKCGKAIEIYSKEHPSVMKLTYGDSSRTNTKYALPFDYTDLASTFYGVKVYNKGKIEMEILFNQDEARKIAGLKDDDKRMVYGYTMDGNKKKPLFWNDGDSVFADSLIAELTRAPGFRDLIYSIKPAARHCYSKASILGTEIPVVIIMAYCEGLVETLRKAHINYVISDKRSSSYNATHDVIKFSDAYLYYEDTYVGSMLMNGLKEVDTQSHSIQEIDTKSIWTEFLDDYGGRAKSDGLDNFHDLMMDPITIEVCRVYKLPTDFCEMLAYANLLLSTNEYVKHTDLSSNRYRTNEMIAVHAYKCLSRAYANYKIQLKRERSNVAMTMKQSAIIDSIMEESIMSDLSIMNPNLEAEAINAVGFKGLTGMNNDRSYSLDKRTYDPSMTNKIAMSTGFAGNVGVNRQTTIDMQIYGTRGYIKNSDMKDASVTNTLSVTEALTPFGSTRDDPFRTAMTNIQTSKHNMRVKDSMPMLVTCGADQALPYLTGDTFSFKSKGPGKVIKKTDDYMIVEYDKVASAPGMKAPKGGKFREMIDLRENVKKNSDGGFYITVKLDTNLKKGSRFKEKDILAYDHVVYNDKVGDGKNIAYCVGALANVAYLNTDEGFEDSAIISNRLAEALSSEVVGEVAKNLPCNTNIFDIVKKGDKVQEGDTLLLFQSPFEEEDANRIVRNLAIDRKEVSQLGRIPVKSKYTGIVQDIKLYRTVELSEMSPSLRKLFKEYEDKVEVIRKDAEGMMNRVPLEANYKLPAVSKMKNLEGKVRIEFYLKYNDKMGIGDKLVFYSAVKGETKNIFPIGSEPYTDERGESEIIDSLCPLPSLLHRMVASVKIITGLYKGVVELTRYMKEAVGLKYIPYNPREIKK